MQLYAITGLQMLKSEQVGPAESLQALHVLKVSAHVLQNGHFWLKRKSLAQVSFLKLQKRARQFWKWRRELYKTDCNPSGFAPGLEFSTKWVSKPWASTRRTSVRPTEPFGVSIKSLLKVEHIPAMSGQPGPLQLAQGHQDHLSDEQ